MKKKTATVFFGIIVAGLAVSLVTLNECGKTVEVADDEEAEAETSVEDVREAPQPPSPAEPGGENADPPADSDGEKSEGEPASKKPSGARKVEGAASFSSPEAAMRALADEVAGREYDSFVDVVGENAVPQSIREQLKRRIEDPSFTLREGEPITEISKSADVVRWSLNFVPESGDSVEELYVDLDVSDEPSVDFSKVSFPLEVASKDGEKSESKPDSPAPDAKPDAESSESKKEKKATNEVDALSIAQSFAKAVVERDFETARALADPDTVTDERVAALMIAIEEGEFNLKKKRPFVVTLSREDITWVLTRVRGGASGSEVGAGSEEASPVGSAEPSDGGGGSEGGDESREAGGAGRADPPEDASASEFALELGRAEDDWAIRGITFSKVLNALSDRGGGDDDVAYSPIVDDPEGGDSLVLYFGFDEAKLASRGKQQLKIVAGILEENPDRVIRINGHADALGTDDYNRTLSDRRAESIRQGLIDEGVSPDQIVTEAYGESKPRRPNFKSDGTDNPSGRSRNRRAEVYLDF